VNQEDVSVCPRNGRKGLAKPIQRLSSVDSIPITPISPRIHTHHQLVLEPASSVAVDQVRT
ncbi:MAG: hypothetical protein LBG13_01160, partial [Holosporales bacterium]|nr:hypothetical protein [Holosporales bacterium]